MKQKDIIFILASAFFVVFVWIIFEIYHSSVSSTISEKLNVQIVPIKAEFDIKTINSIKNKDKIAPLYEGAEPSPSLGISPSPSPALAQPESSINQASSGGSITL